MLPRLVRRSLRRILAREQLWNGNRERWSALIGRHSLIAWAITSHRRTGEQLPTLLTQARESGAAAVRLRPPRQARCWWTGSGPSASGSAARSAGPAQGVALHPFGPDDAAAVMVGR